MFKIKPSRISDDKPLLTLFGSQPVYGIFDGAGSIRFES